jgi:NTP pyrophosphatase (non-canonical NTP hydrolase)
MVGTCDQQDLFEVAQTAARWLDQHNGQSRHETQCRILKLSEETGEVAKAWIGATGQNPRKGVTHTYTDVADELADVCMSSLVAIHSIGFDPADVMARLMTKVVARLTANSDPLNPLTYQHDPWCPVWTTPNSELTENTCDCKGGEQR